MDKISRAYTNFVLPKSNVTDYNFLIILSNRSLYNKYIITRAIVTDK